ncbi:MAG: NAD-dependent deacylase [Synergistaceae bacterium]|jgi:NAD-dependent deacetylase|nr:NAD-dependent deacylase [Synergistaceae bacterium]
MNDQGLKTLASRIVGTRDAVIFTGAGMGTESGLSDFRSKNGMWNVEDPMELATTTAMRRNYDKFHAFYSRRFEAMGNAKPNTGHETVAELESRGLVKCVITQNIDGLHAAAGSKAIYELHGSVNKVRCMECGAPSARRDFIDRVPCRVCGGRLRPGVVLFGEGLPEDAFSASWDASRSCGVFIVLGSSLQVSPANQMPSIAKSAGACVAICNRDITPMDYLADYRTDRGIGEFLTALRKEIDEASGGR